MFENIWKKSAPVQKPEDPPRHGTLFMATETNDLKVMAIQRYKGVTTIKTFDPENRSIGEWYEYRVSDNMHEVLVRHFAKRFEGFLVEGDNSIPCGVEMAKTLEDIQTREKLCEEERYRLKELKRNLDPSNSLS